MPESIRLSDAPGQAGVTQDAASRGLQWICYALAALLPLGVLAAWVMASDQTLLLNAQSPSTVKLLAAWQRWAGAALSLLPAACLSWALVQAGHCFGQFAKGNYFTLAAVSRLRQVAAAFFVSGLASILVPPLLSLLLAEATGGKRGLALSFGSQDALLLLFAAIVWQIARVLRRANALAAENAQFI